MFWTAYVSDWITALFLKCRRASKRDLGPFPLLPLPGSASAMHVPVPNAWGHTAPSFQTELRPLLLCFDIHSMTKHKKTQSFSTSVNLLRGWELLWGPVVLLCWLPGAECRSVALAQGTQGYALSLSRDFTEEISREETKKQAIQIGLLVYYLRK